MKYVKFLETGRFRLDRVFYDGVQLIGYYELCELKKAKAAMHRIMRERQAKSPVPDLQFTWYKKHNRLSCIEMSDVLFGCTLVLRVVSVKNEITYFIPPCDAE